MPVVHFLNVRSGDCSIIKHGSGRISIIDVNNASPARESEAGAVSERGGAVSGSDRFQP